AGPTNGFPARSSLSPGCSPTSMTLARVGPSPGTACVAFLYSGQRTHPFSALRRADSERTTGTSSSTGATALWPATTRLVMDDDGGNALTALGVMYALG